MSHKSFLKAFLLVNAIFLTVSLSKAQAEVNSLTEGRFGIDLPILPISSLSLLSGVDNLIGIRYHLTDSTVIAPGISLGNTNTSTKTTSTFKDTSQASRLQLAVYYIVPVSENIFIEMGPSIGTISTSSKEEVSTTNTIETKATHTITSLSLRPIALFANSFGIYANLSYMMVNKDETATPTSGTKTTTSTTSNALYSSLGFIWYL